LAPIIVVGADEVVDSLHIIHKTGTFVRAGHLIGAGRGWDAPMSLVGRADISAASRGRNIPWLPFVRREFSERNEAPAAREQFLPGAR